MDDAKRDIHISKRKLASYSIIVLIFLAIIVIGYLMTNTTDADLNEPKILSFKQDDENPTLMNVTISFHLKIKNSFFTVKTPTCVSPGLAGYKVRIGVDAMTGNYEDYNLYYLADCAQSLPKLYSPGILYEADIELEFGFSLGEFKFITQAYAIDLDHKNAITLMISSIDPFVYEFTE